MEKQRTCDAGTETPRQKPSLADLAVMAQAADKRPFQEYLRMLISRRNGDQSTAPNSAAN